VLNKLQANVTLTEPALKFTQLIVRVGRLNERSTAEEVAWLTSAC
jgi:hypothetical protein